MPHCSILNFSLCKHLTTTLPSYCNAIICIRTNHLLFLSSLSFFKRSIQVDYQLDLESAKSKKTITTPTTASAKGTQRRTHKVSALRKCRNRQKCQKISRIEENNADLVMQTHKGWIAYFHLSPLQIQQHKMIHNLTLVLIDLVKCLAPRHKAKHSLLSTTAKTFALQGLCGNDKKEEAELCTKIEIVIN